MEKSHTDLGYKENNHKKAKAPGKAPAFLKLCTHSSPATRPDWALSTSKHLLQGQATLPLGSGRKFPTGSLAIQMP